MNKSMKTQENAHRLKLLFFHNTLPEYRIGWFQCLAKRADVDFVFTNEKLNKKDYGFDIEYERTSNLNCTFLSDKLKGFAELIKLMKGIDTYDFVELPPIDSLKEVIYSLYIVYTCKKNKVKIGYFWEKWEAPKDKQPIKRRLKNYILRVIPGSIYKKADVIFSVGQMNKRYFISNGVQENKIAWLPDVSETPNCEYVDIREKYNISEKTLIMCLGRVMRQKGARHLIDAFALIPTQICQNMHLIIAGDGEDLLECKNLAARSGLGNITFTGSVDPAIRGNYFSQCDIFVYPVSYYKGWVDVWGLTVNEAIQHGKPVIATNAVGSAYELIKHGVNGFMLDASDEKMLPHEIAGAIVKCDESMASLAKDYDRELAKKYSFENMAKVYLEEVQILV